MKKRNSLLGFLCVPMFALAQQTLATSGGEATGEAGTSSYTYGQVFYMVASSSDVSIIQGVQQPFEVSVTLSVVGIGDNIHLDYYPNPVVDYLNLNIKGMDVSGLLYELFDAGGKLVGSGRLKRAETQIYMGSLQQAMYQLKIRNSNRTIKIFKIIKN